MTAARPRPQPFLSVQDIAELLDVSKMTVYRLVNSGDLQAYRIGRTIRVRPSDFSQFMRASAMSDLWETER